MKTPFQQFQQQQQQRQRDMQGYAWTQQQQRKQKEMAAHANRQFAPKTSERFTKVEQMANGLRRQAAAGKLSQQELQAKLHELMVQDSFGIWWKVGTESGRWYRYDGKNWVPGMRPGIGTAKRASTISAASTASGHGSIIKAFLIIVFGAGISFGLFMGAGFGSYEIFHGKTSQDIAKGVSLIIAAVAGLLGLIVTVKKARKAARGY